MIRVRATQQMPASAERTWALLTDWSAHSRWIPATVVSVVEDSGGVGTRFVGRSALGPLGFDDPMTVTVFDPPTATSSGRCEIVKTGSVVLGTAGFTVSATSPNSCSVTWWEDVEVAPASLTRWADPISARLATYGFARVLRAAAADL